MYNEGTRRERRKEKIRSKGKLGKERKKGEEEKEKGKKTWKEGRKISKEVKSEICSLLGVVMKSDLVLFALYVLDTAYLGQLFGCHALPAARNHAVRSEGALGAGWVLSEEVTVQHVRHLSPVVVVRLLLMQRLLRRLLANLNTQR